jgi:hypothetical protein
MVANHLIRIVASLAIATATIALPSAAECPPDPPPPECDNDGQFVGGRWDLSQINGTYTISGSEVFYPYLDDPGTSDDYQVDGSLSVQMDGGSEENYLEVECDGTVTGQFKQRYTGTIDKTENISYYDPKYCIQEPSDMSWSITVERTVSVTGSVSGYGQLDLELSVDTATFELDGSLAQSFDCVFISGSGNVSSLDISGDTESVRMSGGYDPDNGTFEPSITVTSSKPWIDDVLHRVKLDQDHQYQDDTITLSPSFSGGGAQAPLQEYNEYVLQDAVTVTGNEDATAEPKTPAITSMELQEPSQYLSDVNVDTRVEVEIEWYGQPPGQVEFTYGGTTETVSGGDTVTWDFDAGDSGTTIEAVAISGSERSEPYTINTPKVDIPGWAGSSSDWSGSSGVSYEATLDWPVSLETTKTLDTISLFTGLWGISGSASSEFNANANSNGSPGSGDMTTEADFQFAGQSATFSMEGPNQTTLSCEELTTAGSATATAQGPTWQKTINPLTAVPGLQSAACGLSGLLCGVVNSVGIKAQASATLSGTATYSDTGSEIQWDGGSIGGSITGRISAGANVPPPLSSVAGVEVYGSATGCIEFMVAPDLELTTVGGTLNAGASAWFMGQTTSVDEETPFGDGCGKAAPAKLLGTAVGWVPADGQLAMTATGSGESFVGIAVWTETPAGQVRPSGDIWYRFYAAGAWGTPQQLTNDAASDVAPTVDFDSTGRALIVYQRSTNALPSGLGDLPAFANGYELHWAAVDPVTALPTASGQLTSNAAHDLGPRLIRDTGGDLHLFWQRADGTEITGTAAAPVSILVDTWNPTTVAWSGETTAASGLEDTFGWSPAAHTADTMLIGLIVDVDGDLTTGADRELFQISRSGGSWARPIQVTTNLVADDAVLAAYDATGTPQLLWRREAAVQQLRGDLAASPAPAFTTEDPSLDDGIGAEFAAGLAAAENGGFAVLWIEGVDARLGRDDGAGWRPPKTPFASGESETVHFLRQLDGSLVAGYAVRSFVGDGSTLATVVEPRFAEIPGDGLFSDGFENGTLSAWSAVTQ